MDEQIITFINTNRVEVIWDSSQQYLCYINAGGAYGLGMTFLEALTNGINNYKEHGHQTTTP